MAKKDWYTIAKFGDQPGAYRVSKFGPDGEHLQDYYLSKQANSFTCTCYAGHKFCRHKQMFDHFELNKRIGTGHQLNFDKMIWKDPVDFGEM